MLSSLPCWRAVTMEKVLVKGTHGHPDTAYVIQRRQLCSASNCPEFRPACTVAGGHVHSAELTDFQDRIALPEESQLPQNADRATPQNRG